MLGFPKEYANSGIGCVGLSWVLYSSSYSFNNFHIGTCQDPWSSGPSLQVRKELCIWLVLYSLLKITPIDLRPGNSKHKIHLSFDQADLPVIWNCTWRCGCTRGSELVNWVMELETRKQEKFTDQKAITATEIKRLQTWHWTPFGKG